MQICIRTWMLAGRMLMIFSGPTASSIAITVVMHITHPAKRHGFEELGAVYLQDLQCSSVEQSLGNEHGDIGTLLFQKIRSVYLNHMPERYLAQGKRSTKQKYRTYEVCSKSSYPILSKSLLYFRTATKGAYSSYPGPSSIIQWCK
jgi:hypothetical protein